MDREEEERLRDEIDKGTLEVGINKIDPDAFDKENRSPALKGAKWGMGVGFAVGLIYSRLHSPLGFYSGAIDLGVLLLGCTALGAAIGAFVMLHWDKSARAQD